MGGARQPRCASPDEVMPSDCVLTRGPDVVPAAATTLLEREILDALEVPLRPSDFFRRFRAPRPEIARTIVRLYRLGLVRPLGHVVVPLESRPRGARRVQERPSPSSFRVATPIGTPRPNFTPAPPAPVRPLRRPPAPPAAETAPAAEAAAEPTPPAPEAPSRRWQVAASVATAASLAGAILRTVLESVRGG